MDDLQPEQLEILFRWFKEGPAGAIPIEQDGRPLGVLQAAGWEDAGTPGLMETLARWHGPPFSASAVRRWLIDEVLPAPDRMLFWVKDVRGGIVGHVGLSRIDPVQGTVAIRDVLCGIPAGAALLAVALETLIDWAQHSLGLRASREEDQLNAA
jgi:hypothetical protein